MKTVREVYNGHCCPDDPECEHSFMSDSELEDHMHSLVDEHAIKEDVIRRVNES